MPPTKAHRQRFATWIGVGTAACVAAYCLFMAWTEYRLSTANQASTCTVLDTTTKSVEGSTSRTSLLVQFEHSVGGKKYAGEQTLRVPSEELTRYTYRDYARGRQISCLYVAGRPDLVTLELRGAGDWGPLAGFGAAMLLGIGAMFLFDRRRKR